MHSKRKQGPPWTVALFGISSILVVGFDLAVLRLSWFDLLWDALILWTVFSVSRRRSIFARWIFSAFYGAGFLIMLSLGIFGMLRLIDLEWTAWVLLVANVIQLMLLWSPSTTGWVTSRGQSESYIETFS